VHEEKWTLEGLGSLDDFGEVTGVPATLRPFSRPGFWGKLGAWMGNLLRGKIRWKLRSCRCWCWRFAS